MKKYGIALVLLLPIFAFSLKNNLPMEHTMPTETSFFDFKMTAIDGKEIDLSAFAGKPILVVNVASKCGYTPQYEELQALHEAHGDKVTILGFPANNFGGQEPGTNAEIASFCQQNYGVTFQMFSKISVKGKDVHPLYQWLAEKSGKSPSWNFCKYLVSADGKTVTFFPSSTKPMSEDITAKL